MTVFKRNPFVRILGSLELAVGLLLIFGIAIAAATFIETLHGTEAARGRVYNAGWFELVLALLVINLSLLLIRRAPYQGRKIGFVFMHLAVIVILVGAGITRYFGYEGIMPIREGESTDWMYSARDHIQLRVADEQVSFPVRLYQPEPHLNRDLQITGETFRVAVRQYWPHCEEQWQAGEGGSPVLNLVTVQRDEVRQLALPLGTDLWLGGVRATFVSGSLPPDTGAEPFGVVRIRIAGESFNLVVSAEPPVAVSRDGYRFEITEFHPDFKVGQEPDPSQPLNNPMVRLSITDPDGRQGERMLFAFHPEFSMSHSGQEEAFRNLHLLYQLEPGLTFAVGDGDTVRARANLPLQIVDVATTKASGDIAGGESFVVATGNSVYQNQDNDLTFTLESYLPSAVRSPVASDDPHQPAAVLLAVEGPDGDVVESLVYKDTPEPTRIELAGRELELAYGPVVIPLPYELQLDDFVLDTYPGSDNPASYESHVRLFDPGQGIDGRPVRIFMNHPLTHRGFKHFQSSYDSDRLGTVLSVNFDPGKWPTYAGYILLTVGFLLILVKNVLRLRGAAGLGFWMLMIVAAAGGGLAQAQSTTDADSTRPTVPTVQSERQRHAGRATGRIITDTVRPAAGRLIVQDYQGRMKPLDTLSREMVMKVTKKGHFEGWEPIDLYLSWLTFPESWWHYPLLAVRTPELKAMLGLNPDASYIAAADLFDDEGRYRLGDTAEDALRTPDKDRTKVQRKLRSFDERFQLFYATLRGSSFRAFPVPGDENNSWLAYWDLEDRIEGELATRYQETADTFFSGLAAGDEAQISAGIAGIAAIQAEFGGEVKPSAGAVTAELRLNRLNPFGWSTLPYLAACGLLLVVFFWNLARRQGAPLSWRNPFYLAGNLLYAAAWLLHLAGYILRWIASGRAPLSNGYESLVFISLTVALAGLIFEWMSRRGAVAGLAAFLTAGILGVAMMATFDPAIGPLVPVLVSVWLIIHVTVITASYGCLGLACLVGMLILVLHFAKGPNRDTVRTTIQWLDRVNVHVVQWGLLLLTVGTMLGGVWANESWGRYWGCDANVTWSLVSIIVYAVVLHLRWLPGWNRPWYFAAGCFAAIASIVMTYFGVNYFLGGLHSYASGDVATVPSWVNIGVAVILGLIFCSWWCERSRSWSD
ncbi:MAG: cytochrome c biogenesis protein CcsA [bacterium]